MHLTYRVARVIPNLHKWADSTTKANSENCQKYHSLLNIVSIVKDQVGLFLFLFLLLLRAVPYLASQRIQKRSCHNITFLSISTNSITICLSNYSHLDLSTSSTCQIWNPNFLNQEHLTIGQTFLTSDKMLFTLAMYLHRASAVKILRSLGQ